MIDSDELARRIRYAFDKAKWGTKAAVARECDITAQAVTGWEKTGSIEKRHLSALARRTGRRLEYFLDASIQDAESAAAAVEVAAPIPEILVITHNALMISRGNYDLSQLEDAQEFAAAYERATRSGAAGKADAFDALEADRVAQAREQEELSRRVSESQKRGSGTEKPEGKVSTRKK